MAFLQYVFQYRFRDIGDLIRNSRRAPLPCHESLAGKTVVLTGATAGIGRETARLLAAQGARLILLNRDPAKSEALEKELRDQYGAEVTTILVDLSSLEQVRRAAGELNRWPDPLDVIIHNAGVYYSTRTVTADGLEMVFQVNHLGSFLLNHLLLDRLRREARARIVHVNSEGHRFALGGVHVNDLLWQWHFYGGLKSYGAAKTAQLLCQRKFQDLLAGTGVTVNAMHPGNVVTDIGSNNGPQYLAKKEKWVLSSALQPEVSARALHWLAASPDMAGVTGKFYHLTTEERPAPHARDARAAERVWQKSLELCGLA